jgi:hypothetical protein
MRAIQWNKGEKMNKNLLIILILITSAITYNMPAKAETDAKILSSSGTATINAEPDTAIFSLAIETENKLLSQAMQENTDKARKVVSEIKKILGKDDLITTTGFNVNPIYNYDNKERKSVLSSYRVTNMVNIKTKKINDVGKLMDTAITCGANRTESLDFIVENKEKYSNDLLKKAAEEAKQKAFSTAQALGLCIKGVNRVSTNFSNETISPYYNRGTFSAMGAKSAMSEDFTPPIEAGEVKLYATVTVDFLIENIK